MRFDHSELLCESSCKSFYNYPAWLLSAELLAMYELLLLGSSTTIALSFRGERESLIEEIRPLVWLALPRSCKIRLVCDRVRRCFAPSVGYKTRFRECNSHVFSCGMKVRTRSYGQVIWRLLGPSSTAVDIVGFRCRTFRSRNDLKDVLRGIVCSTIQVHKHMKRRGTSCKSLSLPLQKGKNDTNFFSFSAVRVKYPTKCST